MDLTPKQQAVELIKKAQSILILGHKKPSGDMIGSGLALFQVLRTAGKKVDFVVSEALPQKYNFLNLAGVKERFDYLEGKLLRIDTNKIPVKGLKYQKSNEYLDIFLDTDKNLKFEFIEIKNGTDKPDLIIALDTKNLQELDAAYQKTPEVFVGVPIVNIDHHSGNDFFGATNLVDLTASSTAEILVSLFEALGFKLNQPEAATALLTGIIEDTKSFQTETTTPKALTVAAQLLAAGAAQQKIIASLFRNEADALVTVWKKIAAQVEKDKKFNLSWTGLGISDLEGISEADLLKMAQEKSAGLNEKFLLIYEVEGRNFKGYFASSDELEKNNMAASLKGNNVNGGIKFSVGAQNLNDAKLKALKLLVEFWSSQKKIPGTGLWEVIADGSESDLTPPETLKEIQAATDLSFPETKLDAEATGTTLEKPSRKYVSEKQTENPVRPKKEKAFDPIDNALRSLAENQVETKGFIPLKEIMEKKKKELEKEPEIDVFDEEE